MTTVAALRALFGNPGFVAVCMFRAQAALVRRRHFALASLVRSWCISVTGADFVPGCEIGPGLLIHHPVGIVLGAGARIGSSCTLLQGVTLGERYGDGSGDHRYPELGDFVTVGAGAVVLGGVRVGDGASIGANAVVLKDVPAGSSAVGIPARVIPG